MQNEIRLLLPNVSRQKHGIITTLVSSFTGLAYEGISSFLQQKCKNALHKAVNALNNQANVQNNKLMKLDDTMLMYGIYSTETLEKLIKQYMKYTMQPLLMKNYLQESKTIHYLEYFTQMP